MDLPWLVELCGQKVVGNIRLEKGKSTIQVFCGCADEIFVGSAMKGLY